MAKFKVSALITGISGKLGGIIFGYSSNGTTARTNNWSQQPASPRQTIQRQKIYWASQMWRTLSLADKATWSAASVNYPRTNVFGDTFYFNGFQVFQFLNQNLIQVGSAINTTAPTFVAVSLPTIGLISSVPGQLQMTFSGCSNNTIIRIYATNQMVNPMNLGIAHYQLVDTFNASASTSGRSFGNQWQAVFGSLISGQYVFAVIKVLASPSGNTTEFSQSVNVANA
jgi:hypothetical protein